MCTPAIRVILVFGLYPSLKDAGTVQMGVARAKWPRTSGEVVRVHRPPPGTRFNRLRPKVRRVPRTASPAPRPPHRVPRAAWRERSWVFRANPGAG